MTTHFPLFLVTRPGPRGPGSAPVLDEVLALLAFDQVPELMFLGLGVQELLPGPDGGPGAWGLAVAHGMAPPSVCAESLAALGLPAEALCLPVQVYPAAVLSQRLHARGSVLHLLHGAELGDHRRQLISALVAPGDDFVLCGEAVRLAQCVDLPRLSDGITGLVLAEDCRLRGLPPLIPPLRPIDDAEWVQLSLRHPQVLSHD